MLLSLNNILLIEPDRVAGNFVWLLICCLYVGFALVQLIDDVVRCALTDMGYASIRLARCTMTSVFSASLFMVRKK